MRILPLYELQSTVLKGGLLQGTIIGHIKGDTRSSDYSSYELMSPLRLQRRH